MCCRFTLRKSPASLAKQLPELNVSAALNRHFAPRYNIAPTQAVLAVRRSQASDFRAEFTFLSWGLVPHWAKDANLATSLVNARAESAAQKPSFKGPIRHHRCLIPADGFYEWTRVGKEARAHFFTRAQEESFCFAGLWEHWGSPDGSEIESCTLLTCAANADIEPYHHRMPLTIAPADFERWLDPSLQTVAAIADLLLPPPANTWQVRAVGPAVNNVRNDGAECLLPPEPPRQRELF